MIRRILASGAAVSAVSALTAFACSQRENGHGARPLNAIAHIYDGGDPPAHDGENRRNTALGLAIHTGACVFWAVLFESFLGRRARQNIGNAAAAGAATAATAYVVDYYVVHPRFRPGFERYLSSRSMFGVYAAIAAGFAVAALLTPERRRARRKAAAPA
ncbi:MAG TPA: hypothetical protein VNU64_05300 [Burkholderiales bacterium]|nr:hypothetical protein [Burkholderiales bacterium]